MSERAHLCAYDYMSATATFGNMANGFVCAKKKHRQPDQLRNPMDDQRRRSADELYKTKTKNGSVLDD